MDNKKVSHTEPSDAALLRDFKKAVQKSSVFERIYTKYEKLIWHIARRCFSNNNDAADICQEIAVKIYKGLANVTVEGEGTLKGWICRVASNACADELRKRKAETVPLPESAEGPEAVQRTPDVLKAPAAEDEAVALIRAEELYKIIRKLPEDQRLMIILRDMEGLSYSELAEAADINLNTVKSRLSRAREALRELIKNETQEAVSQNI
jgi:RNA polymerase sigma-70 factor (ECF subfamily)